MRIAMKFLGALTISSLLLLLGYSFAMYVPIEISEVPLERLIKNLEKEAGDRPKDYLPRLDLGRLYAMAYSLKSEIIPIRKKDDSVWYGYEHDNVPHNQVRETKDDNTLKRAKNHLDMAINWYEEALKLAPNDLIVQLGYGWCLDQAGRRDEAKKSIAKLLIQVMNKKKEMQKNQALINIQLPQKRIIILSHFLILKKTKMNSNDSKRD